MALSYSYRARFQYCFFFVFYIKTWFILKNCEEFRIVLQNHNTQYEAKFYYIISIPNVVKVGVIRIKLIFKEITYSDAYTTVSMVLLYNLATMDKFQKEIWRYAIRRFHSKVVYVYLLSFWSRVSTNIQIFCSFPTNFVRFFLSASLKIVANGTVGGGGVGSTERKHLCLR